MFIQRFAIFALTVGITSALHAQSLGNASVESGGGTSDAALALRSLSAATQPTELWITDPSAFSASHPGEWLVGHCARPCLTREEAEQAARKDAGSAVGEMVLDRMNPALFDKQWLRDRVESDVRSGDLITDEFPERFDRPYGTVWTDTVLVNPSPENLDPLIDRYRRDLHLRDHRAQAIRIGAAALTCSAWLAYLLLNTITKGYFTLRLRLVAGTVSALALWVIVGWP
jgi:hypothetical protein